MLDRMAQADVTAPVVDDAPTAAAEAEPVWDEPAPPPAKDPKQRKPPKPVGRTTRVVLRRLDPWSVLKLSLVYYLCVFVVLLVAGVLLWAGANAAGVVGNIETFMEDIGFDDFRFLPGQLFGGIALGGLVLVVAGTFANVLLTVLFNLMSDAVGGLKLTLEESVDRPAAAPAKGSKRSV